MSRLKPVDLLAMGIPCSGASRAGVSKRKLAIMEDHPEVGHLVASAIMIINRIQPAIVVVENVPEYEASASAQILRQHMRDSGYEVQEKVLRARDFGCLENRNRWFMVCSTRGLSVSLEGLEPKVLPVRKLGNYLEPISPDAQDWRTFDYLKSKEVRDAAKGNSFAMQLVTPDSMSVPTLRKGYHKGGSTDPLVVHPSDPQLLRQLTVKEHARIKEVPEHLVADLSKTDGHILLGQGIAYAPVRDLFSRIGECLKQWAHQSVRSDEAVPVGYSLKLATG
jgi:DNA (cytosine-5)-methyltransferase 1